MNKTVIITAILTTILTNIVLSYFWIFLFLGIWGGCGYLAYRLDHKFDSGYSDLVLCLLVGPIAVVFVLMDCYSEIIKWFKGFSIVNKNKENE